MENIIYNKYNEYNNSSGYITNATVTESYITNSTLYESPTRYQELIDRKKTYSNDLTGADTYLSGSFTGTGSITSGATTTDIHDNATVSMWRLTDHGSVSGIRTRVDPRAAIQGIIRSRQSPCIHTCRRPVRTASDIREKRARETLLKVLGESQFRSFLRNGFVTVRGKSGKVYTIHPGSKFTDVYQNGKQIEKLCVIMAGDFPPTDSLIMRFLLILNDENEFRKISKVWAAGHSFWPDIVLPTGNPRSLVEIFRDLKAA